MNQDFNIQNNWNVFQNNRLGKFCAVTEDFEVNPNCSHTSTFTQHSECACDKTQALQRIPPRDTLGEPGVPALPWMDSKNWRSQEH